MALEKERASLLAKRSVSASVSVKEPVSRSDSVSGLPLELESGLELELESVWAAALMAQN